MARTTPAKRTPAPKGTPRPKSSIAKLKPVAEKSASKSAKRKPRISTSGKVSNIRSSVSPIKELSFSMGLEEENKKSATKKPSKTPIKSPSKKSASNKSTTTKTPNKSSSTPANKTSCTPAAPKSASKSISRPASRSSSRPGSPNKSNSHQQQDHLADSLLGNSLSTLREYCSIM